MPLPSFSILRTTLLNLAALQSVVDDEVELPYRAEMRDALLELVDDDPAGYGWSIDILHPGGDIAIVPFERGETPYNGTSPH
ncbi:MAG: hypothetical protein JWM27_1346 [Gemmatimonadetes bacterium]|nr:hypothetical protein [Gemmatimonadota bacterium]